MDNQKLIKYLLFIFNSLTSNTTISFQKTYICVYICIHTYIHTHIHPWLTLKSPNTLGQSHLIM